MIRCITRGFYCPSIVFVTATYFSPFSKHLPIILQYTNKTSLCTQLCCLQGTSCIISPKIWVSIIIACFLQLALRGDKKFRGQTFLLKYEGACFLKLFLETVIHQGRKRKVFDKAHHASFILKSERAWFLQLFLETAI